MRGGTGLFFDRVPLRAVANALLSAGNTTDVSQLRQPQVTGVLPAQAGAPVFPNILPDRLAPTALVSMTTMDRPSMITWLTPAMIVGSASGSCTRSSVSRGGVPNASAASTSSAST